MKMEKIEYEFEDVELLGVYLYPKPRMGGENYPDDEWYLRIVLKMDGKECYVTFGVHSESHTPNVLGSLQESIPLFAKKLNYLKNKIKENAERQAVAPLTIEAEKAYRKWQKKKMKGGKESWEYLKH